MLHSGFWIICADNCHILPTIPLLMFRSEYTEIANGYIISTGSVVHIIIRLLISFIAEKIYTITDKNWVNK
ncbi:hypothetical protein BTO28_09465 [Domibacillus epiphyticus]|uniref:Uncharacterized protein n=1 Tax=Domibacillus epiphyticus TaxID=1714355 RepID=A0A1V2A7H9_9BACI|nr:hypothetical protein BTO28_09465 [Domibacillus epiphyticus]